jgi:hypothetical protein
MNLRGAQFGLGLMLLFAGLGPANAGFGWCGVGCHASPSGACVRDGWELGLPVRNECPAFTSPQPPCGPHHRWDRKMVACFPADASYRGYEIDKIR